MDVWQYAKLEGIELPNLYFAHSREVFERNGSMLAVTEFAVPQEKEKYPPRLFGFAPLVMPHALEQLNLRRPTWMKSFPK